MRLTGRRNKDVDEDFCELEDSVVELVVFKPKLIKTVEKVEDLDILMDLFIRYEEYELCKWVKVEKEVRELKSETNNNKTDII